MKLYAKESGNGQTMVLLHGNGEDSSYFAGQIPFFEKNYHVIAIDTRGHGRSERGTGKFTLERFADDLKEFLDRRRLRKIILLGFSDGGNIALIFSLKYPGYVDRLILNGANLNPFGMKFSVFMSVVCEYASVLEKILVSGRKKSLIVKRELLSLMLFAPWIRGKLLRRLKMPVLVVAGKEDMIRKRHTCRIAHLIPDAKLQIPEGTHFIASENPSSFNHCVEKFLEETNGDEFTQMVRLWGSRRVSRLEKEKMRRAAVLVPLIKKGGEYQVVFEVRASDLKTQPGEICFPGGAVERGETPKKAAIRETMEELLIDRSRIRVIAPLDVLETPGSMEILPFLGILQDYRWSYSEAEVAHTFSVPLRWFAEHEPERYETDLLTVPKEPFPFEDIPNGRDYHWRRGHYDVYFYRREEGIIWGMTAKILHSLAKMYRKDILKKC